MPPDSLTLTPVAGDPFNGGAKYQYTPIDGNPFEQNMALTDYARTLPAPPPAPLDDFGYAPPAAPQPMLPGLAGVAGDPSRSMAVRLPAAIGSSLADQATRLAKSAWGAATLPGDVAKGLVDPSSPEVIRRSTDLAGLLALPAAGAETSADMDFLASKNPRMYNPPAVAPRPFEADYPAGAPSDASGRLVSDIEGRTLGARYVVGRNVVGGDEEALSPAQSIAAGTEAIGASPQTVAARAISGDAGRLVKTSDPTTGSPQYNIMLDRGLPASAAPLVASHEVGHAIDLLSGQIPTEGLNSELRGVYNSLNNPQSHGKPFGPENNGYKGAAVPRELMAEAIRAYMANPNYLKTAAPNTAAAIRAAVNSNPRIANTIQFNAGGLPITLTPVQGDPFSNAE